MTPTPPLSLDSSDDMSSARFAINFKPSSRVNTCSDINRNQQSTQSCRVIRNLGNASSDIFAQAVAHDAHGAYTHRHPQVSYRKQSKWMRSTSLNQWKGPTKRVFQSKQGWLSEPRRVEQRAARRGFLGRGTDVEHDVENGLAAVLAEHLVAVLERGAETRRTIPQILHSIRTVRRRHSQTQTLELYFPYLSHANVLCTLAREEEADTACIGVHGS